MILHPVAINSLSWTWFMTADYVRRNYTQTQADHNSNHWEWIYYEGVQDDTYKSIAYLILTTHILRIIPCDISYVFHHEVSEIHHDCREYQQLFLAGPPYPAYKTEPLQFRADIIAGIYGYTHEVLGREFQEAIVSSMRGTIYFWHRFYKSCPI